jgi:hypothetical protein
MYRIFIRPGNPAVKLYWNLSFEDTYLKSINCLLRHETFSCLAEIARWRCSFRFAGPTRRWSHLAKNAHSCSFPRKIATRIQANLSSEVSKYNETNKLMTSSSTSPAISRNPACPNLKYSTPQRSQTRPAHILHYYRSQCRGRHPESRRNVYLAGLMNPTGNLPPASRASLSVIMAPMTGDSADVPATAMVRPSVTTVQTSFTEKS